MSLTKLQHLHTPQEQLCEPSCLYDKSHGGRCYTPEIREQSGFGDAGPIAASMADAVRGFSALVQPYLRGTQVVSCLYPDKCPNGPTGHPRQEGCMTLKIGVGARAMLAGMSPDAPTTTHANGAKESDAPYAFTSVDGMALHRVAQIQHQGDQKYGVDNWRGISEDDHLNHALAHVFAHLAGDRTDDHIGHAAVRMLFALAVHIRPGYAGKDAYSVEPIA